MKKRKELKIGDEIRIKCIEDNSGNPCLNCCFLNMDCDEFKAAFGSCCDCNRTDGKNVHFEFVEE